MALYQDTTNVTQHKDPAFGSLHGPGDRAPFTGIYRCAGCGHEIVSAYGNPLPSGNHSKHPAGQKIQWQLIVYAGHNV
jgi:hypothetical protein